MCWRNQSKGTRMTQEEIIELAKQAGFEEHQAKFDTRFEPFAKLVAEKEREECAVFAEESFCGCGRSSCIDGDLRAHNIAESIRSRGKE